MKRMIKCITIIFLLSSCSIATDQPNSFETPPSESTNSIILTRTTKPLEATPSPLAIMTSTSTIVPTWTVLPTLTGRETEKFIQGLYDNDICILPCWGGFVPGKTTWQEVQQWMTAANIEMFSSESGGVIYFGNPRLGIKSSIGFRFNDGVVEEISPQIKTKTYDIQPMLIKYGKPDEIWIRTYAATASGYLPFRVVLFYRRGIVIQYEHPAIMDGDDLEGCLLSETGNVEPMLWVWNPDLYDSLLSFAQKTGELGVDEENFYHPLEEATNLTSDELYQALQDTGPNFCIRTPKSLW
jgi:hypothetical protein